MHKNSIIQRSTALWQREQWQEELLNAVEDVSVLCDTLDLPQDLIEQRLLMNPQWKLRAPLPFVSRMRRGDISDPLLLQVLPSKQELETPTGFVDDPLQETGQSPATGLIHKYDGRVLLLAASACAVHCRYCFRREFDYASHSQSRAQWQDSLQYIANNPDINEVILSGGDPLILSDQHFDWLVGEIGLIAHVKRLRIHSRLPVVIPSRINAALLNTLAQSRLQCVMVIHCNHAQELDVELAQSLLALHQNNITLLNQSVLLKGVNDSAQALCELSERLFECKVTPYYLHLLDPVSGSSHYEVCQEQAIKIVAEASTRLSGFLVPKLVREVPGKPAKQSILANF